MIEIQIDTYIKLNNINKPIKYQKSKKKKKHEMLQN